MSDPFQIMEPFCRVRGLAEFVARLCQVLPRLLAAVDSPGVRKHRIWGALLPFGEAYARGTSPFHVVRPDLLAMADGRFMVCEFDFVPAGRGYVLSALQDIDAAAADDFAEASARIYRRQTAPMYYSTGRQPQLYAEISAFCEILRDRHDVDIRALDLSAEPVPEHGTIERLFYRSEIPGVVFPAEVEMATRETFFDSKLLFALVHAEEADGLIGAALGTHDLAFLRTCTPETHLLSRARIERKDWLLEMAAHKTERRDWLIKATEVETDYSWGARGTLLGRRAGKADDFRLPLLYGIGSQRKHVGAQPILQRFHESADATLVWNAIVDGRICNSAAGRFGYHVSEVARRPATNKVFARVGPFLHLCRKTGEAYASPFGMLTLRQDPVAHGASDALTVPLRL